MLIDLPAAPGAAVQVASRLLTLLLAGVLSACSAAETTAPTGSASVDGSSDLDSAATTDADVTTTVDAATIDTAAGSPHDAFTQKDANGDTNTGSPGCGKAPPKLGSVSAGAPGPAWGVNPDYTYTVDVDGVTRSYVLRYPKAYDPKHRYPVVFLFHGTGGSGAEYDYSGVEQAAPKGAAIFVLPVGLDYAWAKANWPGAKKMGWETFNDNTRDLDFFDVLWARVQDDYCVDTTRVFASGHSIGGFMTNYIACVRGDVLRAVAPISGGGPDPYFLQNQVCASANVAARVIHGIDDNVVQFAFGKTSLLYYVKQAGCGSKAVATTPSPCVRYQGCKAGLPVDMCAFSGVGHSKFDWPKLGPTIWGFFAGF
jgi:polyhydroxybutyrate depolymerase